MKTLQVPLFALTFMAMAFAGCQREAAQNKPAAPSVSPAPATAPAAAPPVAAPAPAPAPTPPATQSATTQPTGAPTPAALMEEVIPLLRQKQYEQVFRKYFAPEDLERILQRRSMQELLDSYLEIDAMYLRETLEEAQSLTPQASDGGNTLTYRTTVRQPLVLVKHDGRWYIRN